MNKDILIKLIQNDCELDNYQKDFLTDLWEMVNAWKEVSICLIPMPISEKTKIKIRKILNNIGDEMIQICELMIKENKK